MELKYFTIFFIFLQWVVLLHDCYSLLAKPMWRFISASRSTACAPPPATDHRGKKSLGVDLKVIMERIGVQWDHEDKRNVISIGMDEMLDLFHDEEPSLGEVKDAFSVFDRNKDGYIDARELEYAFSEMGYRRISRSDCVRMIEGYDVDKDGKISFREFLKLMEDCFS